MVLPKEAQRNRSAAGVVDASSLHARSPPPLKSDASTPTPAPHNLEQENVTLRTYIAACEREAARLRAAHEQASSSSSSSSSLSATMLLPRPITLDDSDLSSSIAHEAPIPLWLRTPALLERMPTLLVQYETHIHSLEQHLLQSQQRVTQLEAELEESLLELRDRVSSAAEIHLHKQQEADLSAELDRQRAEIQEAHQSQLQKDAQFEMKSLALQAQVEQWSLKASLAEASMLQVERQAVMLSHAEMEVKEITEHATSVASELMELKAHHRRLEAESSQNAANVLQAQVEKDQAMKTIQLLDEQIRALKSGHRDSTTELKSSHERVLNLQMEVENLQLTLERERESSKHTLLNHKALVEEMRSRSVAELAANQTCVKAELIRLQEQSIKHESKAQEARLQCERLQRELVATRDCQERLQHETRAEIAAARHEVVQIKSSQLDWQEQQARRQHLVEEERSELTRAQDAFSQQSCDLRAQLSRANQIAMAAETQVLALQAQIAESRQCAEKHQRALNSAVLSHESALAQVASASIEKEREQLATLHTAQQTLDQKNQELEVMRRQLSHLQQEHQEASVESTRLREAYHAQSQEMQRSRQSRQAALTMLESSQALTGDMEARHQALNHDRRDLRLRLDSVESSKSTAEIQRVRALALVDELRKDRDEWHKRAELEKTKTRLARGALDRRAASAKLVTRSNAYALSPPNHLHLSLSSPVEVHRSEIQLPPPQTLSMRK